MKRVAIIQSNYLPWRGYFDLIKNVDLFIVFDDIQYPVGRNWRNRNQLKTKTGLKWVTVPVKSRSEKLPIDQVLINYDNKPWQSIHRQILKESLGVAPFFNDAISIWEEGVSYNDTKIHQLNVRLIKILSNYLGITTDFMNARDLDVTGTKTERLINILKKVDASTYISGPTARNYMDESLFRENGFRLEYKTYDYLPYPQQWGEFMGNVSVLDLIANTGQDARRYLKSQSPNQVVVE